MILAIPHILNNFFFAAREMMFDISRLFVQIWESAEWTNKHVLNTWNSKVHELCF